jgi:hypothetical protein
MKTQTRIPIWILDFLVDDNGGIFHNSMFKEAEKLHKESEKKNEQR